VSGIPLTDPPFLCHEGAKVSLCLSRYVHLFKSDDSVIAFNSLTLESWKLDAAESESLSDTRSLPDPLPDHLAPLALRGLLIRPEDDIPGRAVAKLADQRRRRAMGPAGRFGTLRIALTERCNMACTYCFQQQFYPDDQPVMTADQLTEQIRWFVGQAASRPVTVQYFGGEPMLEWELVQLGNALLRDSVDEGVIPAYRQTMTTNGTLLTPVRAELLNQQGFDLIFSFDGPPEVNDSLRVSRNGRGTFERAADGLRNWAAAGGVPGILMTATPGNVTHLPDYASWFLKESGLGIRVLAINSPQPTSTGWETGGAELARAIFKIWTVCLEEGVEFQGPGTLIPWHLRTRRSQVNRCVDSDLLENGAGSWPVYVSADGRRSLCLVHHNDPRVVAPASDEHGAAASWHLAAAQEPECDRCVASQMCGGPCALERLLWGPGVRRDRCDFIRTMTRLVFTQA
jgi:uncharacterized protein